MRRDFEKISEGARERENGKTSFLSFPETDPFPNMEKTMNRTILILAAILAVAWPAAGWGQTLPLDEVLGKIQEQYEKNADFKADFGQETFIKSLGKKQQADFSRDPRKLANKPGMEFSARCDSRIGGRATVFIIRLPIRNPLQNWNRDWPPVNLW